MGLPVRLVEGLGSSRHLISKNSPLALDFHLGESPCSKVGMGKSPWCCVVMGKVRSPMGLPVRLVQSLGSSRHLIPKNSPLALDLHLCEAPYCCVGMGKVRSPMGVPDQRRCDICQTSNSKEQPFCSGFPLRWVTMLLGRDGEVRSPMDLPDLYRVWVLPDIWSQRTALWHWVST